MKEMKLLYLVLLKQTPQITPTIRDCEYEDLTEGGIVNFFSGLAFAEQIRQTICLVLPERKDCLGAKWSFWGSRPRKKPPCHGLFDLAFLSWGPCPRKTKSHHPTFQLRSICPFFHTIKLL